MVADGYKETEIGVIPVEWEVISLEGICINKGLRRGPFGGALKKGIFVSDGYKVYEQKNAIKKDLEIGKYFITREKYNEMEAFQIKENDFLVSCSGTIGRIVKVISPYKEGIINQALLKITLNDKVDNDFFQFQFNSKRIQSLIIDNTQGGAMPNLVGMSIFRATKFIIPPLKEQEKIADILSTADAKIDAIASQIEKVETLKKGLLQKLLSEGIGHSEFKDSELGKIPEGWEVVKIVKVLDLMTDYVANGSFASLKENTTVYDNLEYAYYVRLFDLRRGLGHNAQKYVDEATYNFLDKSFLEGDEILIANIGANVGESFLMPKVNIPATLAPNMIELKLNYEKMIPIFCFFYLTSHIGLSELDKVIEGSGQPKINKTKLKTIKIPLPPLKEQKQIAEILSTADEKLEVLRAKKEKYETLKKGLLQKLLSGEVRV